MVYEQKLGALSLQQIQQMQSSRYDPYKPGAFEFSSEYLPYIIGAVGIAGVIILYKMKKKRRKK